MTRDAWAGGLDEAEGINHTRDRRYGKRLSRRIRKDVDEDHLTALYLSRVESDLIRELPTRHRVFADPVGDGLRHGLSSSVYA